MTSSTTNGKLPGSTPTRRRDFGRFVPGAALTASAVYLIAGFTEPSSLHTSSAAPAILSSLSAVSRWFFVAILPAVLAAGLLWVERRDMSAPIRRIICFAALLASGFLMIAFLSGIDR